MIVQLTATEELALHVGFHPGSHPIARITQPILFLAVKKHLASAADRILLGISKASIVQSRLGRVRYSKERHGVSVIGSDSIAGDP